MQSSLITGLRSVELGVVDIAASEAFYTGTWRLSVAARDGAAVYLRGTGAPHHLLSLHPRSSTELLAIIRSTLTELFTEYRDLKVTEQRWFDGQWVPRKTLERFGVLEPEWEEASNEKDIIK